MMSVQDRPFESLQMKEIYSPNWCILLFDGVDAHQIIIHMAIPRLNCLPKRMSTYISLLNPALLRENIRNGTFLCCAFSNVSSNYLPSRIQSHTGCICSTFLHCALLNAVSNCLPKRMHSHIGCICLTFLRCAFSNVSSNYLP